MRSTTRSGTPKSPIMPRSSLLLTVALTLAAGCGITYPDVSSEPRPAVIDPGAPDAPQVVVPQEARVGVPFTVRVTTYGDGCVDKGFTEVAAGPSEADVRPYDFHPTDQNAACTRELRSHLHEASVRLEQPGTGTVRVHGRRMSDGEPVVVTRTVTITL